MTPRRGLRVVIRGSLTDRFWPKVDASGDCWEWTAARNPEGYGRIGAGGTGSRILHAHRVAWELLVGPIPVGYEVDHLCRNRGCVNPDHLEPVTKLENIRRSELRAGQARWRKAHTINRVTQQIAG